MSTQEPQETFLPPFPKVTPIPPNPLGVPSLDHLVQQQVPQTETVQSERPGFKSQLCYPQAVSPREKLPTSLSLSILPCKTGVLTASALQAAVRTKEMAWLQCSAQSWPQVLREWQQLLLPESCLRSAGEWLAAHTGHGMHRRAT